MIEVNNGSIYITTNKLYIIPLESINSYIMNNDEFLQSISMKELLEVFVYGIPNNIKEYLLKKVSLYDSSSAVNAFKFNGLEYWLDKSLRNSLFNLFSNADPEEEFEIVFGDVAIKQPAKILASFLKNLEKYAYKCFVETQKHINAINSIELPKDGKDYQRYLDAIINYDYTTGYPEKIEL